MRVCTIRDVHAVTWDAKKKDANPSNHRGITFEMAQEAFQDPQVIVLENRLIAEIGEQRMQAIGMSGNFLLLLVIFVDRSEEDDLVIHIISARKATAYEQSTYRDRFR